MILFGQSASHLGRISSARLTGIRQAGLEKAICLKAPANGLCLLIKPLPMGDEVLCDVLIFRGPCHLVRFEDHFFLAG